jgi:hypothetical protein
MIVAVSEDGGVVLREADDLKAFKVMATCKEAELARLLAPAGDLDGAGHAWIRRDWLVRNGRPDDPAWLEGFDKMLAYAKDKGWVDAARDSVRAHVEYVGR